jgi:membrane-bound lytic murein transglycosylase D
MPRTAFRPSPLMLLLSATLLTVSGCATVVPPETQGDPIEVALPTQEGSEAFPDQSIGEPTTPTSLWDQLPQNGVTVPDGALWERLRAQYALPEPEHQWIENERDWYADHPDYIIRVFTRAAPYLRHIVDEIEARGMPMEIALLPVVESAFDPFAYSHGRAAGLWQFIPATGRDYGLDQDWWYDGRRDPVEATRAALDYLEALHDLFDDWLLAVAAYNSGEGNVARQIRRNESRGEPTDFFNLRLPRETRAYVPRLIAISQIVADPEAYGVQLPYLPDEHYLERVELDRQIDLALAAEMAEIEITDLYLLNAGYNRWATRPESSGLNLPVENARLFRERLAAMGDRELVSSVRYSVRSGDTLSGIAEDHGTTVELLRRANGMNGNMIRIGQDLMVPTPTAAAEAYALSAEARLGRTLNTPRGEQRVDYQTQPGDSLWAIAQRYDVTVRQLARWNGMAPRDPLAVGRDLVIWLDGSQVGLYGAMAVQPSVEDRIRRVNYVVRRGDSLSRIANRFNVNVRQITRWNDLNPERYLQPGQRLVLFVDVTEQAD